MPGFFLHTSNRMEVLADRLAEALSALPLPPMVPETIIVQNRSMERYILMELADKQGIAANFSFPFPNAAVRSIFGIFFPDLPERSLFDRDILVWKIMEVLPSLVSKEGFERIAAYLKEKDDYIKQFQLCMKIAYLYDQYVVFRPDMVQQWEKKGKTEAEDEYWQAELWRAIDKSTDMDRAALRRRFFKALKENGEKVQQLPTRLTLFGISSLPLFHLEVLQALSEFIDIHVFAMNPSEAFWDDIISEKRLAKKKTVIRNGDIDKLHYETRNPLLSSMGDQGREFFTLLNTMPCQEDRMFEKPDGSTMLSSLQADIFSLSVPEARRAIAEDDRSIQIHSCHSPMRELEVLYDNLLSFFEEDHALLPKDIIVMTPDIETYAPYIDAVFGVTREGCPQIPYSIADRTVRSESRIIDDFFRILKIRRSRFSAEEVCGLLDSEVILRKMGIDEADMEQVHRWIEKTNIRWGLDADDRVHDNLPGMEENTWRAGFDSLYLGFAMQGGNHEMYGGIIPCEGVDGNTTLLLGKLAAFIDSLKSASQALENTHTLAGWSEVLGRIVDTFFPADTEDERALQALRSSIADLVQQQSVSGFDTAVDFGVILTWLESTLAEKGFGTGFRSGAVTFCAMLPMRSIPAKIIAMLGMNDGSFPRNHAKLGFDLIALHPGVGDRDMRRDDRYIFLEGLLSARDKCYISYVGQSVEDNAEIPPSVLVSELVDYMEKYHTGPGEIQMRDFLTTKHRLQAFSDAYFHAEDETDAQNALFSYSQENLGGAKALLKEQRGTPSFIEEPLPPLPPQEEEDRKQVTLDQLISFFSNPARFFIRQRLGIDLSGSGGIIETDEPFELDALDEYKLRQDILDARLKGRNSQQIYDEMRRRGVLPHGTVGEAAYQVTALNTGEFAGVVEAAWKNPAVQTFADIAVSIDDFRIHGRIRHIMTGYLLQYRDAEMKPKDYLRIWLAHLLLNIQDTRDLPGESVLIGRKKKKSLRITFGPVSSAEEILRDMLRIYRQGLHEPIPFFPGTSWEYIESYKPEAGDRNTFLSDCSSWKGRDTIPGESNDPYVVQCWGNREPFDEPFAEIAERVYKPLMESMCEVKDSKGSRNE